MTGRDIAAALDQPQARCLRSLATEGSVNSDALVLREDIRAALIRTDETKPLGRVVPLHGAKLLDRGPVGRGMRRSRQICGSLWSRTPRQLWRRGAGIHAEDLRHLRSVGARSLNIELQAALNPAGECKVERFGWTFARRDKVMQIENDHDKDVYNGDIGYIDDGIPTRANSPPVSTAAPSPTASANSTL